MSELDFSEDIKGYFDEHDFQKFIAAIPKTKSFIENQFRTKSVNVSAFDMQVFFIISYYLCLRGAEIKRLQKENFDIKNRLCNATNRKGKMQRTTIAPPALPILSLWLKVKQVKKWEKGLFDVSRATIHNIVKEAGKIAGIEYFDQFEKRQINGLYTYLFKHAYAQRMEELGCPGSLISLKLRHSKKSKDGMQASTMNYTQNLKRLLVWEHKNIKEVIELDA